MVALKSAEEVSLLRSTVPCHVPLPVAPEKLPVPPVTVNGPSIWKTPGEASCMTDQ